MTVILQIASLIALVALAAAWGSWVWDSHRTISTPERLGEVVVHGVEATAAEATARALAVGVAGAISEHYRTVDFINNAADTADQSLIRPGGAAPEPLLLQGGSGGERLDISVEVAGAKFDSRGLSSLFQRTQPQRGTLTLAVSLVPAGSDGSWRAVASASFPENSAYGFRTEAAGALDEIAQVIGLRFIQAHYAAGDPFFAALGGDDFRKLWEVRRSAAELALRGASGDPAAADPLRKEAETEYRKIAHLVTRYRRRVELQKLGSYLATAMGNLEAARQHIADARDNTEDAEERRSLDSLLPELNVEIANRQERAPPTETVSPAATGPALEERLEELARQNKPLIDSLKLDGLRSQDLPRRPQIGVVIGRPPKEWDARVRYVGATDAPVDEGLAFYSVAVLSLVASLAPQAEIFVSPIVSVTRGAASRQELDRAQRVLGGMELDVIFWPFGESARAFGKEDGATRWARSVTEQLDSIAGFGGLVVIPAGNESVALPAVTTSGGVPAHSIIGATGETGAPTSYSNHGAGVDFLVSGEVAVLVETGGIAQQRGTGFSAAAFATGAALVAASVGTPPDGARLRAVLEETAYRPSDGALPLPDFAAAADRLRPAPGG